MFTGKQPPRRVFLKHPATLGAWGLVLGCTLPPLLHAAATLPVPSGLFVVSGGAGIRSAANATSLTIQQTTPRVTLNWDSFNIAQGHTVTFDQPSASALAINLIHQSDPSNIRGNLTANGEVWLINQNGVVFGDGARVDVRGLIASSLSPTPAALQNGIAPPNALGFDGKSFEGPLDANGIALAGAVTVDANARLTTNAASGRIFLLAPKVTNEGVITAKDGQVALAAGSEVYIRQPGSGQGGGLLVEVGKGGILTNGADTNAGQKDPSKLLGQVIADRGTATLVGLSVNQFGRVSANSAVRANGTVRLLARNSQANAGSATLLPVEGGTLRLGADSVTAVNPEETFTPDAAGKLVAVTATDASVTLPGQVLAVGSRVILEGGALLQSHGGDVKIRANDAGDENALVVDTAPASQSRIVMRAQSRIDVSGANSVAAADRDFLTVELLGVELKDRPVQRDGLLRGQTVTVDLRQRGTLADGTPWVGTPLADLTGTASAYLQRNNLERNSLGGTVSLAALGAVLLETGSIIDVSGGRVEVPASSQHTTQLIREGRVVDIGLADPSVSYDGIFGQVERAHAVRTQTGGRKIEKAGTETWQIFETASNTRSGAGYFEGKDAGTLELVAPRMELGGQFLGAYTTGVHQRTQTDVLLGTPLARPYDQRPRAGALSLGVQDNTLADPQFITPDTRIAAARGATLPANFDLENTALQDLPRQVNLATDWFGPGQLGELRLFSEGRITLAAGAVLNLGGGGRVNFEAGSIDLAGTLLAPGGTVNMLARDTFESPGVAPSTGGIRLAGGGVVDVSGLWTNDLALLNTTSPDGRSPILPRAGAITLAALGRVVNEGGVELQAGSVLRADGGGYLSAKRQLTAGAGGAISVGVRSDQRASELVAPFILDPGSKISAYGLEQGGSLAFTAVDFCIGSGACGAASLTRIDLEPGFFTQGGFNRYTLTSAGGGINFTAGSTVRLRAENLLPTADLARVKTGADLRDFTQVGARDDQQRTGVDLTAVVKADSPTGVFTDEILQGAGFLNVGTGARIEAEPGATIALSSNTRVFIDGAIRAPSGALNVTLTSGINGSKLAEFLPSQTLWLGPHAALEAPGSFLPLADERGFLAGTLTNAGNVSLAARSGYLVAQAGAMIDVQASSALLDITPLGISAAAPVRQTLSSAAGNISLFAAEGIFYDGAFRAGAATAGARSGSLRVEIAAQLRNDFAEVPAADLNLPTGSRYIQLDATPGSTLAAGLRPGLPVPLADNGRAALSPAQLSAGEFGDITLRARNYLRSAGDGESFGSIHLLGDVALAASRRLVLDASSLESNGGSLTLRAPYLALGNSDNNADNGGPHGQLTGPASDGRGTLLANADFLEFIGHWQLNGFARADFRSAGDLRLRGVQLINISPVETFGSGKLETSANLAFTAAQIYPASLSDYTLAVSNNPTGRLEIFGSAAGGAVLSVGGALTVQAPFIQQGGTLRAPMGALNLNAGTELTLLPGSLTATSLDAVSALFGRVELGQDWVYQLDARKSQLVFTAQNTRPSDPFPAAAVTLRAPDINFLPGAKVDQSGGGDLLAYEFEPGLQGSRDPLSGNTSFAVLPALRLDYAPFDPQEQLGFGLAPGESIAISSQLAGLEPGLYPLLPAHFALLPGGLLLTPQDHYTDLAAGVSVALRPVAQFDPSTHAAIGQYVPGTVVSGRRVFANGTEGDARTSGWLVRSASQVAKLGRLATYSATDFPGLTGQARPQDAGVLQLDASRSLRLGGAFQALAAAQGRQGRVEVAGANLTVVPTLQGVTPPAGSLFIEAAGLNALGAQTLLLGATSHLDAQGQRRLNVTASHLTIAGGAALSGPEIVLAASDSITLAEGASLLSVGTIDDQLSNDLQVNGDGALLRVSTGALATLVRTGQTGVTGSVQVETGARLSSVGSTLLDASAQMSLAGQLNLGGSLSLAAPRISLGDPVATPAGLVLGSALLRSFKLDELRLASRQGLDVYGSLDLAFNDLVVQGPGIVGYENAGQNVGLRARTLTVSNPDGATYVAPAGAVPGTGLLTVQAEDIRLADTGAAAVLLGGFTHTTLTASQALVGVGTAALQVDGALTLLTPNLTPLRGGKLSLTATGALAALTPGLSPASDGLDTLGGQVALTGSRVWLDTRIGAAGGLVSLHAMGPAPSDDVMLAGNALIDVTGPAVNLQGFPVAIAGGSIDISSDHGAIHGAAGSALRLGSELGRAGSLSLSAPTGQLFFADVAVQAHAGEGAAQGSLVLDIGSLTRPAVFGELLANFSAGGFREEIAARIRHGDLLIATGQDLSAHILRLAADDGDLLVEATLDASGARGGLMSLAASDTLALSSTAHLDVRATGVGERGGRVELYTATADAGVAAVGDVNTAPGSLIDLRGGAGGLGGTLAVRAPQVGAGSEVAVTALNGTVQGADARTVEGFRVYLDSDIDATDLATYNADAAAFMANATTIESRLGAGWRLMPGVEVRSTSSDTALAQSDLALNAIADLSTWRWNDLPGVMTLRAAGDLRINDILSDGFAGTADLALSSENGTSLRCSGAGSCGVRPTALPSLLRGPSWSYRLVAGADLDSASILALTGAADRQRNGAAMGSVTLAPGTPSDRNPRTGPTTIPVLRPILNAVRTGTGSIEIAAGQDITLANRASVIYTAGEDSQQGILLGAPGGAGRSTLGQRAYPEHGGTLTLRAGGSLNGVAPTLDFNLDAAEFPRQLVSSWLVRQGNADGADRATAWTVAPEWFEQGIAALAGGDITIDAGGDLYNLSVASASIGRQVGGTTAALSEVEETGGGELQIRVGGDVQGGVFYLGKGTAKLAAAGSLVGGRPLFPGADAPLYPVLALGASAFDIQALGSVTLSAVVNPTFIAQGPVQKQPVARTRNSYFLSYTDASRVGIQAFNGDITLQEGAQIAGGAFENDFSGAVDSVPLRVYPPTLEAVAVSGSITLDGSFTLFPSTAGNLRLLAGDSVFLNASLALSDADPAGLPGIKAPLSFATPDSVNALLKLLDPTPSAGALASTPLHADHDAALAVIVANTGDVVSALGALTFLSRPAEIAAGQDLINPYFWIQNTLVSDVTVFKAGRDIRYESQRTATDSTIGFPGYLLPLTSGIELWGPGRLVLETGRDLDLGTGSGIISRGNSVNGALQGPGGAVSVFAGLGTHGLNFDAFIQRYFETGLYAVQLPGQTALSPAEALETLKTLPPERQLQPVLDAFFNELRNSGRTAALSTPKDYSQGNLAIATLLGDGQLHRVEREIFADSSAGASQATVLRTIAYDTPIPPGLYAGDINLYFSQIASVAGGDIDLIAPGGRLNVGLATPPDSFGIAKASADLGLITQTVGDDIRALLAGDLDVNESRVVSADRGDILVWSSNGDVDAGRGSRSALAAPGNTFQFDENGIVTVSAPAPVEGSGIQALTSDANQPAGEVTLAAPSGVVDAGEAGIKGGKINIAAPETRNSGRISGTSVSGVAATSVGVSASVAGAGGAAGGATKGVADTGSERRQPAGTGDVASSSMSLISVEFLGFGDS